MATAETTPAGPDAGAVFDRLPLETQLALAARALKRLGTRVPIPLHDEGGQVGHFVPPFGRPDEPVDLTPGLLARVRRHFTRRRTYSVEEVLVELRRIAEDRGDVPQSQPAYGTTRQSD